MSSALSITQAVNPPRAAFLDFPLGHTAGKPNDRPLQRRIMIDTLSALDSIQLPGTIRRLPYRWSESDDWKETAMRPQPGDGHRDDRIERNDSPQYEREADEQAARAAEANGGCPGCYFPD